MLRGDIAGILSATGVICALVRPFNLSYCNEPFLAVDRQRADGAAAKSHCGMAMLNRVLEILGIVILPINNYQIFSPARDEEFSIVQKAKVAGAQEGPITRIRRVTLECLLAQLGLIPVTLRNARTRNPDLSYMTRWTGAERFRVYDQNSLRQ